MLRTLIVMVALMGWYMPLSAQTKVKKPTSAKTKSIPSAIMLSGKNIYNKYCLACHMADGGGVQNMNPPLIKTTYVLEDKARLIGIILKGMSEGVEIDGETYTNIMPPHNFLKDQEIADVLTYVRNSFGNKASIITAAEVKTNRAIKK